MNTSESIAHDLLRYLREHPDVCAEGTTRGWRWLRFVDGEWRVTTYGGPHRLKRRVMGTVYDDEQALSWMVSNPLTLIPASEAYLWGPSDETVWEDADTQDVFTDADRCFWCGVSERDEPLERYETTDQGACLFCEDCHESWDKADEIVGEAGVKA